MESDGFRRAFLRWVAERRGLSWIPGEETFAAAREARLERLGNLISENVNRDALLRLIDGGPPSGLPVVAGQLVSRLAGQQTVVADISGDKVSPPVDGEMSPPNPPALAVPYSIERRSES